MGLDHSQESASAEATGEASSYRRLGLVSAGLILGWLVVAIYVLDASLPFNPIRLPFEQALQLRRIVPEGWAFFTRDPREPQPLPFSRGPDRRWRSASLGPNGRWVHAMGFDRTPRAQGTELRHPTGGGGQGFLAGM